MTSLLYVCLDGLGDDPLPELDGRTPLEAADTPALDGLAQRGRSGTVVTVGPGIAPESDIAVFAILGYDPTEEHPGRGVVEAIGIDLPFRTGDLAYRVNFATAAWPEIVDRRVGRDLTSDEAGALADEVNRRLRLPDATFELRATVEHRGVLVLRSAEGPLSAQVSNTDPAYRKEGSLGVALETFEARVATCVPLDASREAARSAALTNAFVEESARILDASETNRRRRAAGKMPGNVILTRDGGDTVPTLQPIRERFGRSWGCFVEMPVERGIARVLGMEPVDVPRLATESDYATWAERAAEALGEFEAVYVHLKGPDVPAHDGRGTDKRDVIAQIDRAFFGEVLPRLDLRRTVVAVTADHSTSCARRAHTADPVPLVVAGAGVSPDGCASFGERAAAGGALGALRGVDILPRLVPLLA
ncbi:MAG: 2,3-bisphosphoglycerate-independent phosphoglycerate mutase [Actinomycetota bacterium]